MKAKLPMSSSRLTAKITIIESAKTRNRKTIAFNTSESCPTWRWIRAWRKAKSSDLVVLSGTTLWKKMSTRKQSRTLWPLNNDLLYTYFTKTYLSKFLQVKLSKLLHINCHSSDCLIDLAVEVTALFVELFRVAHCDHLLHYPTFTCN